MSMALDDVCSLSVICQLHFNLTGVRAKVRSLVNSTLPQMPTMLSPAKQSRHLPNGRRESAVVMGLKRVGTRSKSCLDRDTGRAKRDLGMRFPGN